MADSHFSIGFKITLSKVVCEKIKASQYLERGSSARQITSHELAEHGVLVVQVMGRFVQDEELAAIGVRP